MVVMVAMLLPFLLPVDAHMHMGAAHTALLVGLGAHGHTLRQGFVQSPQKVLLRAMQLQKRGHEHVARRAHTAINV